jgi:hypothetical protein
MISEKDLDPKFIREVRKSILDVEKIKDQIIALNENDTTLEQNVNKTMESFKKQITEVINKVVISLNELIDKDEKDQTKVYEEFRKVYTLIETGEKTYKEALRKIGEDLDANIKKIYNLDGYIKIEEGKAKGVKLPEERLFAEKFRVETVKEIIREQPIIHEIEKKVAPILTKSMLEHYYDYGTKLSEEVMAPKYIQGYDKLQVDKNVEHFYKSDKKIILFKFIRTLLLVFLEDGTTEITNIVKGTSIYKGNIIKDIREQLSLDISPLEITAIQPVGQGFYIATLNNGVLFYNIFEKTLSSRMIEDGVIYIEQYDDKILLVSDVISIYNEE